MAHFAKINDQNIVEQVIVAEQEFIDSGAVGDPTRWIQTSYNTRNGFHIMGGTPLRKNYASVGFTYDPISDAFIPPKPEGTFVLETSTATWVRPKPYPVDRNDPRAPWYIWSEPLQDWVLVDDPLMIGK